MLIFFFFLCVLMVGERLSGRPIVEEMVAMAFSGVHLGLKKLKMWTLWKLGELYRDDNKIVRDWGFT